MAQLCSAPASSQPATAAEGWEACSAPAGAGPLPATASSAPIAAATAVARPPSLAERRVGSLAMAGLSASHRHTLAVGDRARARIVSRHPRAIDVRRGRADVSENAPLDELRRVAIVRNDTELGRRRWSRTLWPRSHDAASANASSRPRSVTF